MDTEAKERMQPKLALQHKSVTHKVPYRISIRFISNKSSPWLFKWQEPWWIKKEVKEDRKRRRNMGQSSFQTGHFPPSFCLSNTALLPTSLETLSHTLPPASPELPTAICYKNFSVGLHVVWFLKSCSPFLTWFVGYWVVTGPLNDGRKIRHCRQCLVLINSVLSGACTVVRAASYNCRFDASVTCLLALATFLNFPLNRAQHL